MIDKTLLGVSNTLLPLFEAGGEATKPVVFHLYRVRRNFHSNILPITQLPSSSSGAAGSIFQSSQAQAPAKLKEMRNGFFGPTGNYCSTVH